MKIAVLGIGLVLAGCTTVPVTQNQADGAMESGRAMLTTELAYARAPRCKAGANWSVGVPCSTLAGVKVIAPLSQIVVNDINQLEMDTAGGKVTYNEVQLLLAAIGNLQSALNSLEKIA